MNLKPLIIAMAVTLGIISQAQAFEPLLKLQREWNGWTACVETYCCDDYHAKSLPCAVGAKCFECPDYCAKPLPCLLSGKAAFLCDDFCPKPLPPTCYPSVKNLRCVPSRLPPTTWTLPKAAAAPMVDKP